MSSISVTKNSVTIKDLVVKDDETVKIMNDIEEKKREEYMIKSINIGTNVLRNQMATGDVNYVEKEFQRLAKTIGENTDGWDKLIKKSMTEALDPDNNDSNIIRYIIQSIDKLRDEVFEKKREGETKSVKKGEIFEKEVFDYLSDICSPHKDEITDTSKVKGSRGDKGDIVVEIDGDPTKKIVIECKDDDRGYVSSIKKVRDELEEGMANRDAKFGIFLFRREEQMPRQFKPIKVTNKYVVTSHEDYGLEYVYRLARSMVTIGTGSENKVDAEEIKNQIEQFKQKLSDFTQILKEVTKIENSSQYLRDNIEKMRDDIETTLKNIEKNLS